MGGNVSWREAMPELEVLEREPLGEHTTFRIGGPARWFLRPGTTEEAAEVLKLCRENGVKPFFLGNGSNVLAADSGFDGVVISTAGLDGLSSDAEGRIVAGSGVSLARLAHFAAQNALTGLEFAQGIPGSVGGGTRMNAGAYGGELKDTIAWVEALDEEGKLRRFAASDCGFSYRHSIFCAQPLLITAVCFAPRPGDPAEIRAVMEDLARRRREKQPLEYPSAGSTFKRPEGQFAAALIDGCGLKGLRVGDAQVSEKHAGFVVNVGHATAADVWAVMEEVRATVAERTGVKLEPEVELLGQI